jgi:hypothetical protein
MGRGYAFTELMDMQIVLGNCEGNATAETILQETEYGCMLSVRILMSRR